MTALETYNKWLNEPLLTQNEKEELESIKDNMDEINDRFAVELEFGTAGLRGKMALGTNRMNVYIVRKATQGLANYLVKHYENPSIAIAYDSRHNSHEFACEAAKVLAGNRVKVYLYRELTPTPSLSFAVRRLNLSAGIVVTASHNPKEYNGYKVYGDDGSQMPPEAASEVLNEINHLDIFKDVVVGDFDKAVYKEQIVFIDDALLEEFIEGDVKQSLLSVEESPRNLKIAYTPLHGTGLRCVKTALNHDGFNNISVVKEQAHPNGDFPTASYPNPEMKEALTYGVNLMLKDNCDVLLATDPDCDRVGVVCNQHGVPSYLTGNEMGMLIFDFVYQMRKAHNTLPKNPVMIKTIVTSDLIDIMAKAYNVEAKSCLTGFKFICGEMRKLENEGRLDDFLFGFEESVGYLTNPNIRDKDAVNAVVVIAEMANYYKNQGKTLTDHLNELYDTFGHYKTNTLNFYFEGLEGKDKINNLMKRVRAGEIEKIIADRVVRKGDYLKGIIYENGKELPTNLPSSNVIKYYLTNGETLTLRPSGTEPKIKCYIFAKDSENLKFYEQLVQDLVK